MIAHYTQSDFQTEVLESDIPVLIDFYADWCGPCKMMAPVLEQISEELKGKLKVGKINVDEEGELAAAYKVMSIPNFIVFKNGEAAKQVIGAMPKAEFLAQIEEVL